MKSWIESLDLHRVVDEERLVEWLLDRGFEAHPSRKDEYISDTCPSCGTGDKAWRYMVSASGLTNCYSCGYSRFGFSMVADWDGISVSDAMAEVGSAEVVGSETIWKEPSYAAKVTNAEPVPVAPDAGIVHWLTAEPLPAEWMEQALAACVARGYTREFLVAKAVGFALSGRYMGRVVIPVYFEGVWVWLQAWDYTRTSPIKYHSPPRCEGAVQRRHILYQWDIYKQAETLVVAEGMFNAWAAEVAGFPAVASFGKGMTEDQFRLLLHSPVKTIILAYDADARFVAGPLAHRLICQGKTTTLVRYADARDLDDLTTQECIAALHNAAPPDWLHDSPPTNPAQRRKPSGAKFSTSPGTWRSTQRTRRANW